MTTKILTQRELDQMEERFRAIGAACGPRAMNSTTSSANPPIRPAKPTPAQIYAQYKTLKGAERLAYFVNHAVTIWDHYTQNDQHD